MTGHGGNIHEASRKTGIPPERILDFSASINPLGLPKPATAAILKGITLLPHYPEPYAGSLTACIARHYDLAPESLLCGNGSTELIYLIPRVLRPKKVLITAPAFSEYERACTRSRKSEVTCQKLTVQSGDWLMWCDVFNFRNESNYYKVIFNQIQKQLKLTWSP